MQQSPLLQSTLHRLPVNDIPNGAKVLGLAVLILQIIRMFPSIHAQQRRELPHHRVLIGICADLNLTRLIVLHKPCPATALDTGQRSVEFSFEGGEIAVGGFDRCLFPHSVS